MRAPSAENPKPKNQISILAAFQSMVKAFYQTRKDQKKNQHNQGQNFAYNQKSQEGFTLAPKINVIEPEKQNKKNNNS